MLWDKRCCFTQYIWWQSDKAQSNNFVWQGGCCVYFKCPDHRALRVFNCFGNKVRSNAWNTGLHRFNAL